MSRFADTRATRPVPLGDCECPGTPHADGDWAKIRSDLSGSDIARITSTARLDESAAAEVLAEYIVEWNILDPDGQPWPPSPEGLLLLHQPEQRAIGEAIGEAVKDAASLPNRSGAPSRASSRGSASPTPKRPRTPTT